jgi:hypothetical protein
MTRDQYEHVTAAFALLINAGGGMKPDGEATYSVEMGAKSPVHLITLDDLKRINKRLSRIEGERFSALLQLKGAIESHDEFALARAKERLLNAYRLQEAEARARFREDPNSRAKIGRILAPFMGMSHEDSVRHFEGMQPGPQAMQDASRLLSWAVSSAIGQWAGLALWSVKGAFVPAIHCSGPTSEFAEKIALYVHTFLIAPQGDVGLRACPYCTERFWQDRPNQDYCKPAHREAHRVKRARWRKKQTELSAKHRPKKGTSDGAQKTR